MPVAGDSYTEEQLADSRRKLRVSIGKMKEILSESEWLAGPDYSLADLNTYSLVAGVERLQPEALNKEDTPRSWQWLQSLEDRPGVQTAQAMSNEAPETLRAFGG